jgi:hypothetical protein
LFGAIADVFDCKSVPQVLTVYPELALMGSGLPPQKLLLVLKWLFIEQDLAYWLYRGRDKLMGAIERSAFDLNLPS